MVRSSTLVEAEEDLGGNIGPSRQVLFSSKELY